MDTKKRIESYEWKPWLKRPFGAFMMSVFEEGCTPKYCKKAFVDDCTMKAWFFQYGEWYESHKVWISSMKKFERHLKTHSMDSISKNLLNFRKESIKEIKLLTKSRKDPIKKLKKLKEIYSVSVTYIWISHIIERVYQKRIDELVSKHNIKDSEKYIGDASHPKKKNTHAIMEREIRKGTPISKIAKKYGWLKVRECFDDPFTEEEIKDIALHLKPVEKHKRVKVPKELKKIISDMQELVWYRTARTDVLYEILFLSRPIIKEVGEYYKIPFKELRDYTIPGLIDGSLEMYEYDKFTCFSENGKNHFFREKIVLDEVHKETESVKGTVASKGIVKGRVKVILDVKDLHKIKKDDILVTQMTFPSFISAMVKASAFVTDEGGMTCHAAIVAREMKKPCVIGTRIATKIFKDNDLVEVDADKGIVRKLK